MPLSRIAPQHYRILLEEKVAAVCELLAAHQPPAPQVYPSAPTAFRMRAEFRVWHDGDELNYVMFRPGEPKTPIPVYSLPIACARIQQLMPALRSRLRNSPVLRSRLFQVEFLSTLSKDTLLTLVYHRALGPDWDAAARVLERELDVAIVGRSRRQKRVIGRDYVCEVLAVAGRDYRYRQYEQAFTQPNAALNIRMLEWACSCARDSSGDLLELYCGNGNFTLPLARHFDQVIATEVSKSSIRAARENLAANHIDNVQMIRLSAQEAAQALAGVREFRRLAELPRALRHYNLQTLFVDPPRAGLDPHSLAMASAFDAVIYISCNPHTLSRDLASLTNTHCIVRLALFDQFPYTDHMECGVFLLRR
ncbi:MAG: tRNA (uridine(54)-C5)-methyltransferase TrmA [Halioglobus sp.]|nr:tRNA (uridine(54)-C5)-methyltransferase TrmA [Halioglobus sp.]